MSRSSTITKPAAVAERDLAPVHPGEILRLEYMQPLGLTAYALAARLNVPRTRIERLLREETAMTPDTALRLSRYFETSPEFWLSLQARHDLETVRRAHAGELSRIKPHGEGAA